MELPELKDLHFLALGALIEVKEKTRDKLKEVPFVSELLGIEDEDEDFVLDDFEEEEEEGNLCACGCGETVKKGKKFIKGHYFRVLRRKK
jgi:hypothetical protein